MPNQSVTNIANAIINKINSLISSHNSNSNAHQDIRASIPSAEDNYAPEEDGGAGSSGGASTWSRSDHVHPLSSAYAINGHDHDDDYIPRYDNIYGVSHFTNNEDGTYNYIANNLYYDSNEDIITYKETYLGGDNEIAVKGDIPSLTTNYIQKSNTVGLIKNDGTVDTTPYESLFEDTIDELIEYGESL